MMIAEHRHLAEQGAELVELRLDYIVRSVDLKRLLADRPCPVIATCRREQDGGKWTRSEEERKMLLRTAIADGVDYVCTINEPNIAAMLAGEAEATTKADSTRARYKTMGVRATTGILLGRGLARCRSPPPG